MCKKDLLLLDFEGILKYFRVQLPKKCRNEDNAQQILKTACSIKVKKLKKYEADFLTLKGIRFNQIKLTRVVFFSSFVTGLLLSTKTVYK